MKILLLGEYSNVHATLALGLRRLGHEVTVASDGDSWKGYPRDVDLRRREYGKLGSLFYYLRLWKIFRRFRGYDVVQIINPVFIPLRAQRILPFYRFLRRHNGRIFMGAFGIDHYYCKACADCITFRYSDFNIGSTLRDTYETKVWTDDWINGAKGRLNIRIAADCDGIVAGLYEYYAAYRNEGFRHFTFIPFPIVPVSDNSAPKREVPRKVKFFIGIQRKRSAYKGTDIMLRALERAVALHPDKAEMVKAESVPFAEYRRLMDGSHVILDQLYAYTPAMNALEAMSRGLVVVGGGEPENYEILGEEELRPIINVEPDEESVFKALCGIIEQRSELPALSEASREYIRRHHDYVEVARRYLGFWGEV